MTECQNPVCDPVTLLYSLKENIRTAFVSLCASVFLCMKTAFACIIGFGFSQSLSNSCFLYWFFVNNCPCCYLGIVWGFSLKQFLLNVCKFCRNVQTSWSELVLMIGFLSVTVLLQYHRKGRNSITFAKYVILDSMMSWLEFRSQRAKSLWPHWP